MNTIKYWPAYATYEEDLILKKTKWKQKYRKEHIVKWNDINANVYKWSDGSINRTTYSTYYNRNKRKGYIMIQLYRWIDTHH